LGKTRKSLKKTFVYGQFINHPFNLHLLIKINKLSSTKITLPTKNDSIIEESISGTFGGRPSAIGDDCQ
jgi:hypothetical protein